MNEKELLQDMMKFHGHKCWASVAGLRAGMAALRTLGVDRSPGTQLYGIIEIGEEHSAMCFGDGIQYATGCTFGKGNIRKEPYGKLAFTLIDKETYKAVRVSFNPMHSKEIGQTAFMQKRAAGIYPNEIPEQAVLEPVNIVWDTPEEEVVSVGKVFEYDGELLPEVMGMKPCDACGELVALAYRRVVGDKIMCIPCSGYDR